MRASVSLFNRGMYPPQVIWLTFTFLAWNGNWHLVAIDCFDGHEHYLGEFPKWAINERQQNEVDVAARRLPPSTRPGKDR